MAFKSKFQGMRSIGNSSNSSDERFWSEDYKNDGTYKVRPVCDKNQTMFVEYQVHEVSYKDSRGIDKVYKCICPGIKKESCPICDKVKSTYATKDTDAIEKMKKYINSKKIRVINIRVIDDPNKPELKGKFKLMRINGIVWKEFLKELEPDDTLKKDPEYIEAHPFDPVYGKTLFYVYKKPKKDGRPSWEGTKFLTKPTNILGKSVTEDNAGDFEEDCTKILSNTFILNEYFEEIKSQAGNEEDIMKAVGQKLFGSFNKEQKTELYINNSNSNSNDTEELDNNLEDEKELDNISEKTEETTETVIDLEEDDLPF